MSVRRSVHLTWKDVNFKTGAVRHPLQGGMTPKNEQSARLIFAGAAVAGSHPRFTASRSCIFAAGQPGSSDHEHSERHRQRREEGEIDQAKPLPADSRRTRYRKATLPVSRSREYPSESYRANLGHAAGSRVTDRLLRARLGGGSTATPSRHFDTSQCLNPWQYRATAFGDDRASIRDSRLIYLQNLAEKWRTRPRFELIDLCLEGSPLSASYGCPARRWIARRAQARLAHRRRSWQTACRRL